VELILLSKHLRKNFQIIIVFGHSAFITSQSLFVPMNTALKRYLVCQTSANVNRTAMRAVYPSIHALIKSMLTTSCTTASVERAVYQGGGVTNILAKSLRRTIALQLLW